jgi:hypothetical protein
MGNSRPGKGHELLRGLGSLCTLALSLARSNFVALGRLGKAACDMPRYMLHLDLVCYCAVRN